MPDDPKPTSFEAIEALLSRSGDVLKVLEDWAVRELEAGTPWETVFATTAEIAASVMAGIGPNVRIPVEFAAGIGLKFSRLLTLYNLEKVKDTETQEHTHTTEP